MKNSIFAVNKEDLARVLMHIPVGLVACLLVYAHWSLAIIFAMSFLYYELNEDMHLSDEAFKDVKGFIWGCGIGGVVILALKLAGVI